jgi:hypothetical protein
MRLAIINEISLEMIRWIRISNIFSSVFITASLLLFSARAMSTFHQLKGTDIDGNELSFSKFKNKVVYITNVASA